jgi:hypothetical protein
MEGLEMKLNLPKEWFMKKAKLEDGCEVGAMNPNFLNPAAQLEKAWTEIDALQSELEALRERNRLLEKVVEVARDIHNSEQCTISIRIKSLKSAVKELDAISEPPQTK